MWSTLLYFDSFGIMTEHSLFFASVVNLPFQTFKKIIHLFWIKFATELPISSLHGDDSAISIENLSWWVYGSTLIRFNILYKYIIPPPFRFYKEAMQTIKLLIWPTINIRIYRLYHWKLLSSDSYIWKYFSHEVNWPHYIFQRME